MTATAFLTLLQGAGITLLISGAGIALGVPLGLALALCRWGQVPLLAQVAAFYVSLLRSTPAVTLCMLIFFAVPTFGIDIQGSWGGFAPPFCSNSIEIPSGERTNAI